MKIKRFEKNQNINFIKVKKNEITRLTKNDLFITLYTKIISRKVA